MTSIPKTLNESSDFTAQIINAVPPPSPLAPDDIGGEAWAALRLAIAGLDPEEPSEPKTFEPDAPWRRACFELVRVVLGIPEFEERFRRAWKEHATLSDDERALAWAVMDAWASESFGCRFGDLDENTAALLGLPDDDGAVEREFVACLRRVKYPSAEPGAFWAYAVRQAWASFTGRKPDIRAAGLVHQLGIREPYCRLTVYVLWRLSDCHHGGPFPVSQTRLAAELTRLSKENPGVLGGEVIGQAQVSRFLLFLKARGVLAESGGYVPGIRAKCYTWT